MWLIRRVGPTERLNGGVHTYHWGNAPQAYDAMRAAGQKPVLLVTDAPPWARGTGWDTCPSDIYDKGCAYPPDPSHYDDWQEFVRQAMVKFPQVLAVEIWNEPNLRTFWYDPSPSALDYDNVLAAGCQGAKQGAVDAGISLPPVISAGLAPGPALNGPDPPARRQQGTFLGNVYGYEANKPACADAATNPSPDFRGIGEHVYPDGGPNQQDWVNGQTDTLTEIRNARSDAQDAPARIWITEVGVTTAPNLPSDQRRTESEQGPTLAAMYEKARDQGDVKSFLIHRYRDTPRRDDQTQDQWLHDKWSHIGLVREDDSFTAKPAFSYLRCALGGRGC